MLRPAHPIPAGILASLVGVGIFEVATPWGGIIARQLGLVEHATLDETLFDVLMLLRAPSLFLLALLVGWALYHLLRKTGRFTLGWVVGLPALVGVIVGLVFGVPFFWTSERAQVQVTVTVLAGMIGWGAAGATFWALTHDGRGAPAGILASLVGVAIFEVTASWGLLIVRQLGFASPTARAAGEPWFGTDVWLSPSFFLLELLVGWALYQLLRKAGRFPPGEAVGRHALITVVVGLILWILLPYFFVDLPLAPGGLAQVDSWFAALMWLRAPSLFLLALLVGWALYQFLRKTGRFTLGWVVGLPALVGVIVGLVLGVLFFGTLWTERAQVTATVLAGMIGWGAAGATFWALAHDGRGASAA